MNRTARQRQLRLVLLIGGGTFAFCILALLLADPVSAACACGGGGDYNGAVAVVGGVGAVTAAALAASEDTPDGEETDLAIVQVSADQITVTPDETQPLTLTGWHAGNGGTVTRVPMTLWIEVPPLQGVKVTPTQGVGELMARVSLDESTFDEKATEVQLIAHGSWTGKEATANVTVHLDGGYELRLTDGGGGAD